jgi:hypothetical protein
MDAQEDRSMKAKELIEKHKIPCGPMSVSVEGVCRRRLRDHLDALLDRLTQETHPEGADRDLLELDEEPEIPEEPEPEESRDDKKKRLIEEGRLRAEVSKEVKKYKDKIMPKPKTSDHAEPDEEEEEQGNSKLLQRPDGKMTRWMGRG